MNRHFNQNALEEIDEHKFLANMYQQKWNMRLEINMDDKFPERRYHNLVCLCSHHNTLQLTNI